MRSCGVRPFGEREREKRIYGDATSENPPYIFTSSVLRRRDKGAQIPYYGTSAACRAHTQPAEKR